MDLKDTFVVPSSPQKVWEAVSSPKAMPGWNPKVQRIWPEDEVFDLRQIYDVRYAMNGKVTDFKGRAVEMVPLRRILFLYEPTAGTGPTARESFDLEPATGGTRVTHRVQADDAGIPLWARGLIWLIGKIGKRRGEHPLKEYLDRKS
jgi:uncharacterized protein YndB with AHSA1/START domain